jgi:F-type H+-transporting ATPase subunit epsilon
VLAETAIDLDDLDAKMLAQAIKDAEEDVTDATEPNVRDRAQTRLEQLRQVQTTLNL